MIDYRSLEPYLVDRWEEILGLYGIEVPKMRGKNSVNHPCPCCGGDDRAHWREEDGRLALFCRSCAADSMKSPEDVIMSCTGISFSDLVKDIGDFIGGVSTEDLRRVEHKVATKQKRTTPADHKQRDNAVDVWESMPIIQKHPAFNMYGVQPPYDCRVTALGAPAFDLINENGAIVNIACITNDGIKYLANGISYGSWHLIPRCEARMTDGIAWTSSVITAYHHWYKTGQEVRVTFSYENTAWMYNRGIIKNTSGILDSKDDMPLVDESDDRNEVSDELKKRQLAI
jgi:phage/plasmid primase-like uncharacterized protein